jgi:hypothetical protein
MTTPRQLVETVAGIMGVSAATVIVHDRNLATAPVPLRTVAGRGRAAARVTAVDAANLVIAVAASESVKDSIATVMNYRDLRGKKDKNALACGVRRYDDLPANHTFGQALAAFIDAAAAKEISVSLNLFITFYWPRLKVRISWGEGYSGATYEPKSKLPAREKLVDVGDLERMTSITEKTIFRVGAAVGGAI